MGASKNRSDRSPEQDVKQGAPPRKDRSGNAIGSLTVVSIYEDSEHGDTQ